MPRTACLLGVYHETKKGDADVDIYCAQVRNLEKKEAQLMGA